LSIISNVLFPPEVRAKYFLHGGGLKKAALCGLSSSSIQVLHKIHQAGGAILMY